MNTAQELDFGALNFSGPVACSVMACSSAAKSLSQQAQIIANYFMQPENMDKDTFRDDRAHAANLTAGLGVQVTGLKFAGADGEFKSAPAAPDVTSGNEVGGRA
jgi:hypothetical protein